MYVCMEKESSNTPMQPEGLSDDFFEQILGVPNDDTSTFIGGGSHEVGTMALQLGFGSVCTRYGSGNVNGFRGMDIGMPLGLNLEHGGFLKPEEVDVDRNIDGSSSMSTSRMNGRDSMHLTNLFPAFGHSQTQSVPPPPPPPNQHLQPFHGQPASGMVAAAQHPSTIRPRVRARRGQATDPHSIAERLRRERIAERMRALQELVPCVSKTDRAAMLDETVDYVKFLRLQVKVLSMSRLGGAGAVAHLVAGIPPEGDDTDGGSNQPAWEKWLKDGTEQQVAKLMEDDVGAAMQFLQSKALCIMPMSLAAAIFRTHQPDATTIVKPEYDPRS